jgi:hypothetical protein
VTALAFTSGGKSGWRRLSDSLNECGRGWRNEEGFMPVDSIIWRIIISKKDGGHGLQGVR